MQALLKILTICLEYLQDYFKKREAEKYAEQITAIKDDPTGEFVNEFNGVRNTPNKADVPSDKTDADIDKH